MNIYYDYRISAELFTIVYPKFKKWRKKWAPTEKICYQSKDNRVQNKNEIIPVAKNLLWMQEIL